MTGPGDAPSAGSKPPGSRATSRCGSSTSTPSPNIDSAAIHTLASCDWVKKGFPLCLIGDSGTGKSHLLIAPGTEAAMAGFRVTYVLATKLVNELVEAADESPDQDHRPLRTRRPFAHRRARLHGT